MMTLLKKELREHLPAAAVGLVVLLLLNSAYLRPPEGPDSRIVLNELPLPILKPNYLAMMGLLSWGVAIVLGLLMSWRENTNKTWAFLIHRPATKEQVLGAKLIAGAILYFAGAGLPFLLMAGWCALPGNFPMPCVAGHLLPGLAIVACGYALFLGAFLSGIRPAKWYATRFAPIFGTALILILAAVAKSWLLVAAVLLLAVLMAAVGIRAEFTRPGRRSALLALLISLGIAGMAMLVLEIGTTMALVRNTMAARDWESVQFDSEGTPVRTVNNLFSAKRGYEFWDLEGNPLPKPPVQAIPGMVQFDSGRKLHGRVPLGPRKDCPPVQHFINLGQSREQLYVLGGDGLVACYDWDTRQATGYWGRNGFFAEKSAAEPFSRGLRPFLNAQQNHPYIVGDSQAAYALDAGTHQVARLCEGQPLGITCCVLSFTQVGDQVQYDWGLYVRQSEQIVICDFKGKARASFALPPNLRSVENLQVMQLKNGLLGIVADRRNEAAPGTPNVYVCKLESTGKITWERELTLASPGGNRGRTLQDVVPAISPLFLGAGAAIMWLDGLPFNTTRHGDWTLVGVVGVMVLLACALAAWLLLAGRGLSIRRRLGWSLFALAAGPAAVLAIWALVLDEKRVPCPSCGTKRAPSMGKCPKCSAPWPALARRDVDILPAG